MSDCVRALVWTHYQEKRFGAPLILAVALSDEADDRGGGIFQSISRLALKTRQTERAVRSQLRRLECSGLLQCVELSAGGAGKYHQYRLELGLLIGIENPEYGSGYTRNGVPGFLSKNPEAGSGFSDPSYITILKDTSKVSSDSGFDSEDRRLAEWMLEGIRKNNPKHRDPSWPAWCRDIRLMCRVDKRTHREIAELFQWAAGDSFWHRNVLSPGALRKQWDRLTLERKSKTGAGVQSAPQDTDRNCSRLISGARCGKPGAFWDREGRGLCRGCHEAAEREHANV